MLDCTTNKKGKINLAECIRVGIQLSNTNKLGDDMELKYPVMITLRQIRAAHPFEEGWKKVLAANGGTKADLDSEFELASIIDSSDLNDCLWALQCKPEYQHIYRKFAVVCADEVSALMTDERSLAALNVAWSHSCGEASDGELAAACAGARDAARAAALNAAWAAADAAARAAAWDAARAAAWECQSKVLRRALTTGEISRKCQKS